MTTAHPDSVLRHRPFVLFWFARVAVTVGYQMLVVAVGWQLYALTGDPFDLGLDRADPVHSRDPAGAGRRPGRPTATTGACVLVGCQVDRGGRGGDACSTRVLTGAISRELILGVAFIMGVARAFEVTVMQIIVPSLVPLPLVPRAVAASATANQTATIVGPALGGFLYAAGPAIVYGTCLALFVLAGAAAHR